MDKKLIIDVARLDPEGDALEGEVDVVDIDESLVHSFGGVRYRLTAQLFGTELLVRGQIEQDFDLVCSRCGKDFDTTVHVDDFTTSVEVAECAHEIDISNELRESILLALPTYPVCGDACEGIQQKTEQLHDDRWQALDSVKLGGKK